MEKKAVYSLLAHKNVQTEIGKGEGDVGGLRTRGHPVRTTLKACHGLTVEKNPPEMFNQSGQV